MTHTCDVCGLEHAVDEPTIVEAEPVVEAAAAVQIAEIEASRDVALAKIGAQVEEGYQETEIEALRAELRTMREMLDRMTPPEPEPVPIVVDPDPAPAPEPVVEPAAEAPPVVEPTGRGRKPASPFWR